jgi:hypothetical protein
MARNNTWPYLGLVTLRVGVHCSALVWSLSAGSATQGAALMMAFGIGTLPTLLALGVFAKWLENVRNKPIVRKTAGLIIICFGIYLLFSSNQHYHHVVSMG